MASETASSVRGAAFRTKPLSLAKTCSIGLRARPDGLGLPSPSAHPPPQLAETIG